MAHSSRINILYTNRSDGLRDLGFQTPGSTLPLIQSNTPQGPPKTKSSRTLSTSSTTSTKSQTSVSSRASVVSSATSLSTSPTRMMMGRPDYGYDLPCGFTFIGCGVRFHPDDFELWIAHEISHFTTKGPPTYALCPYCDESEISFRSRGDPAANWRAMLVHLETHYAKFESEDRRRPDFWLINYMKDIGRLSQEDYAIATAYDERPYCDGLVDRNYKTKDALMKEDRASRLVVDNREERRMLRDGRKGKETSHRHHRLHRSVNHDD